MESRGIQIGCDLDKSTAANSFLQKVGIKPTESHQAFGLLSRFLTQKDLRIGFSKKECGTIEWVRMAK